jgi:hypothetical protein
VEPSLALQRTLLALRVARAGSQVDDGLVRDFERFLSELPAAAASPGGLDALRVRVEDWLGRMVGPLFNRIERQLKAPQSHDVAKVREVLRAVWVILGDTAGNAAGDAAGDARGGLAEIGGLLSTAIERDDRAGARRALAAAQAWLKQHEWELIGRLQQPG